MYYAFLLLCVVLDIALHNPRYDPMQHIHRPWLRSNLIRCLLTTGYLSLIMAGCAGTLSPDTTIHQDSRSAVFLQNVSDRSYQAAHPIKLEETTLVNVLRGVHTREKADFLLLFGKALLDASSTPRVTRVFSEDDIAVLTPYLTVALAQAAPNQRVGFRLYNTPNIPTPSQTAGSTFWEKVDGFIGSEPPLAGHVETTAGHLFADGLSLHLTLTHYQHRPGKAHKKMMAEPRPQGNSKGLRDYDVTFLPETAVRSETYMQSGWFGESGKGALVIDYQLLAKLLASPPEAARTATSPAAQSVPTMLEPAGKSDPAMQAFKEELKALQKKVDEQNAELQKLKKSQKMK